MRLSIVTPAHIWNTETADKFLACLKSVEAQTFDHDNFEHVIVNDGSTFPVNIFKHRYTKVINQENLQRITAFNNGLAATTGEIICLLDADDEYEPNYLEEVDKMFTPNCGYKMFNFGAIMLPPNDGKPWQSNIFRPAQQSLGHVVFGGGNVINGTFVFHRSIYEELGAFPQHHIENIDCSEINYGQGLRELWMTSPFDFSAAAQMEFPEIRQFFMVDHQDEPHKIIKELGNPFGNDYYLFYKYTRKNHSLPVEKWLYRVHLKI